MRDEVSFRCGCANGRFKVGTLNESLNLDAVLVMVSQGRQHDLRLPHLTAALGLQPFCRTALGKHLAPERGGGQLQWLRIRCGEGLFVWGGSFGDRQITRSNLRRSPISV